MIMCLLVVSEAKHIKSHQDDCPNMNCNKDDTNKHANVDGGKGHKASALHRTIDN